MAVHLPTGVRIAVAISVDFDTDALRPGTIAGVGHHASSTRRFAVDVGIPRLLALFRDLDVVTTWPTSDHDLVDFPDVVEDVLDEGHEIALHGCHHEGGVPEPDRERELMGTRLRRHDRVVGRAPSGFRAPEWAFTDATLGILGDTGFAWDSSLAGTEFEPYRPSGHESGVLEIPVSWYLDDWPCVEDHRPVFRRWREIFDYAHLRVQDGVYTLTIRPQVIGRAHHVAALEEFLRYLRGFGDVWCTTLSEIRRVWSEPPGESVHRENRKVDYTSTPGLT
ncbi:polysaccharide deacetylase family protein [Amycolatopsis sp. NPDC048633]|uniref:polysaccharide deacetylase family protein n=1 Tax=Amycolatopsis sp. NPDC048633 TaxID=3157095 RepID=UPI0033F7A7B3